MVEQATEALLQAAMTPEQRSDPKAPKRSWPDLTAREARLTLGAKVPTYVHHKRKFALEVAELAKTILEQSGWPVVHVREDAGARELYAWAYTTCGEKKLWDLFVGLERHVRPDGLNLAESGWTVLWWRYDRV